MKKIVGFLVLVIGIALIYVAFTSSDDGYVDVIPFNDMEYTRYDPQEIYSLMDEAVSYAQKGKTRKVVNTLNEVLVEYSHMNTMETLADIRYSADMSDSYYAEEYSYMISVSSQVSQKMYDMFSEIAVTECADELEEDYLGEGYLDSYDPENRVENSELITELLQRENDLYVQYRNALSAGNEMFGPESEYDIPVEGGEIDGESISLEDAYYNEYNPILGQIYVELVKTRMELAQAYGYSSYQEYAYSSLHGRDYSPDDISAYLEDIIEYMVPVYEEVLSDDKTWEKAYYFPTDEDDMMAYIENIAGTFGGDVKDAYDFMVEHDLYDIGDSPNKMDIAFQTYIDDYEAPYLFINPAGYSEDLLTISHEFGHYADAYVNYNAFSDTDTAETLSQGMEYLGILNSDLGRKSKNILLTTKMIDSLGVYIEQSALSYFEDKVYSLNYEDVTVENINQLFYESSVKFGYYTEEYDNYYHKGWIDITHLFEYPFYIISYVTSNDAAMQIYEAEEEQAGAGMELYEKLLSRDTTLPFLSVIEETGMDTPFSSERIMEVQDEFIEFFGVSAIESAA